MSLEKPPVNKLPPREATLPQVLVDLKEEIIGDDDPDAYLKREALPTFAQWVHRDESVKAQPDNPS